MFLIGEYNSCKVVTPLKLLPLHVCCISRQRVVNSSINLKRVLLLNVIIVDILQPMGSFEIGIPKPCTILYAINESIYMFAKFKSMFMGRIINRIVLTKIF